MSTETGIVVESAALCTAFRSRCDPGILDVAYRVEPVKRVDAPDRSVWITREGGQEKRHDAEPGMGMFQGIGQSIMRILPVDAQL